MKNKQFSWLNGKTIEEAFLFKHAAGLTGEQYLFLKFTDQTGCVIEGANLGETRIDNTLEIYPVSFYDGKERVDTAKITRIKEW